MADLLLRGRNGKRGDGGEDKPLYLPPGRIPLLCLRVPRLAKPVDRRGTLSGGRYMPCARPVHHRTLLANAFSSRQWALSLSTFPSFPRAMTCKECWMVAAGQT